MSSDDFVELSEEFLGLERDLGLLEKTISDVYFWERVRFSVHSRLRRTLSEDQSKFGQDDTAKNYMAGLKLLFKNFIIKNPFLTQNTQLLFYGTGRRKKFDDGLWWDIYQDPVMEETDEDCLLWERPYKLTHLTPPKTSNLKYVDAVEYLGTLLEKSGISSISLSEDEMSFLERVENKIAARFGVGIPVLSMVKEDLAKRRARLPLYRWLLRKVDPSIAFLTVSYNGRETFVEACQLEDVPVIELQHGAMSRYHMGYSFPYGDKHAFPDYFFSFGEFWSDLVDLPLPEERIHPVGYPHLEKEKNKYDNLRKRKQTVFISQETIGKELSRFAVALEDSEDYKHNIVYKLHPREYDYWEGQYPWLEQSNLRVIDSDESPLYRLFAESTAQVGVGSTALYEGLSFGLKTFILDIPSEKHKLAPLIEDGYAKLVDSPADLIDLSRTDKLQESDSRSVFESNAIENIQESIDSILTKDENCNRTV